MAEYLRQPDQADRLLELHDELDRLSARPSLIKMSVSSVGLMFIGVVALKLLRVGLGTPVGMEMVIILLVAVSVMAALGFFKLARIRRLRHEIADLTAANSPGELPPETA